MEIAVPGQVEKIIQKLEENGYEGYAVGGCVRDALLLRAPNDWDITTSATPGQVKELFKRTVDTGIQHGTVTVLMDGEGFEVTTYRIDGEYEDGRHPKGVSFTRNLAEDLRRRDFTINAMAYNQKEGLVDQFHGMEDLENRVIRCVGDARERFAEDALRILRAVRFAAQLGFEIEGETFEAMKALSGTLERISAERIQAELVKLLCSDHPQTLKKAYEAGVTAVVLPEFDRMMQTFQNNPHHWLNVGEHTLEVLKAVGPDKVLRLAALCHDFGKPQTKTADVEGTDHFYGHAKVSAQMAKVLLRRLRMDNDSIFQVERLVLYHDYHAGASERSVRKAVCKVGRELFPKLLMLQRADVMAQSDYQREEKLDGLGRTEAFYHQILEKRQCLSLKELAVTGKDLIGAGMKPGREIGRVLNGMLQDVLEDPGRNTREYLMSRLEERRNRTDE